MQEESQPTTIAQIRQDQIDFMSQMGNKLTETMEGFLEKLSKAPLGLRTSDNNNINTAEESCMSRNGAESPDSHKDDDQLSLEVSDDEYQEDPLEHYADNQKQDNQMVDTEYKQLNF